MERETSSALPRMSYGMISTFIMIWQEFNYFLSFLFHPDNIKNPSTSDFKRTISVNELWAVHGGAKGLAVKLRTDIKV
jgi:hypothetical protein